MWYQINWFLQSYSDFSIANHCSHCQINSGWRTTKQLFQAEIDQIQVFLELPLVGWLAAAFFILFAPPVLLMYMLSVPYSCRDIMLLPWLLQSIYSLKNDFRPCFSVWSSGTSYDYNRGFFWGWKSMKIFYTN